MIEFTKEETLQLLRAFSGLEGALIATRHDSKIDWNILCESYVDASVELLFKKLLERE